MAAVGSPCRNGLSMSNRKSVTTESAWLMPGALRVFSVFVLYEVMEVHELLDSPARISLSIFATSFLLDSLVSFAYTLFPSRYSAYMWSWSWPFSRMIQPQGRAYTALDDEENKMTGAQIALTLFHALLSYLSLRLWCQVRIGARTNREGEKETGEKARVRDLSHRPKASHAPGCFQFITDVHLLWTRGGGKKRLRSGTVAACFQSKLDKSVSDSALTFVFFFSLFLFQFFSHCSPLSKV